MKVFTFLFIITIFNCILSIWHNAILSFHQNKEKARIIAKVPPFFYRVELFKAKVLKYWRGGQNILGKSPPASLGEGLEYPKQK